MLRQLLSFLLLSKLSNLPARNHKYFFTVVLLFVSHNSVACNFNDEVYSQLDYGLYWFGTENQCQKADSNNQNEFYNPKNKTLIFIHGLHSGKDKVQFRETFNPIQLEAGGPNINFADFWINKGWNVGILYWNQFANERQVKNAEAKIWTATGKKRMRWRDVAGNYQDFDTDLNVSELLSNNLVNNLSNFDGSHLRIVGHSLGSQVAISVSKNLLDASLSGRVSPKLIPDRIALLDAFSSNGKKKYLNRRWVGEVMRDYVASLQSFGVVFESYRTSATTSTIFVGDENKELNDMTAFVEMKNDYFGPLDFRKKHLAAPWRYFWSIDYPAPEIEQAELPAPSASTSDLRIEQMQSNNMTGSVVQIDGATTKSPFDDRYRYSSRLANKNKKHANNPLEGSYQLSTQEQRAADNNWGLRKTRMLEAWQILHSKNILPGEGVVIAHTDTGISEHPELEGNNFTPSPIDISSAKDYVDGDGFPEHNFDAINLIPRHGHGTETASVIVSPIGCPTGFSEPCVTGAAPYAKLVPIRVSDAVIIATGKRLAKGVDHAVDIGADIISISMGGVGNLPELHQAIQRANDAGIIVIAAGSNFTASIPVKPAAWETTIAVGAVRESLTPWIGSAFGPWIDISAPGVNIFHARTERNDGRIEYSVKKARGTSDAASLVSGAAALWLSYHGKDNLVSQYGAKNVPAIFKQILREHGVFRTKNFPKTGYGTGILDAALLLEAPLP
ncbi:S8 family serine peptidase [Aliikangiella marina]|uniref:S8 family serine peptidase n=1 Tax=Aliikangiella marina TaxID=1712262 RepID=A0A545T4U6_9GAMM|nr:S8 family serine peptidase [Aliikangiella marina]TQV72202.1 S8 family serine peptidase [Aliikangiella marina]